MKQDYIDMINRKITQSPNFSNSGIAQRILNPPVIQEPIQALQVPSVQTTQVPQAQATLDTSEEIRNKIFNTRQFPSDWVTTDNGISYHAPS